MTGDYSCGFITTDSSVNNLISQITGLENRKITELFRTLPPEDAGKIFSTLWNSVRMRQH